MRKATVIILVGIFCFWMAAPPAMGGGMSILGVGAKAKGMGGAFRAIADDWSAAYYNPAGLFYMTDNQLTFNEVVTHYRVKYEPNVNYGGYDVGFYNGEISNRYEILTNPTLGGYFKLPVGGQSITAGLALFQPFDQNIAWQVFQSPNSGFGLPGQQFEHNFDAVAINVVGAMELIEDKLSIGISAGILKADLVYGGFFLRANPADPNATYYDQIAGRPNELITEYARSDGNGLAPNFRLGLLMKASPKLQFGLSITPKTTITVDGDSYFYYYMPDIPQYFNRGLAGEVVPGNEDYILSSGARLTGNATFETEIVLPTQVGAGVAYQVTERLLIAGDLEFTTWSDFEGYKFDYEFSNFSTGSSTIDAWAATDLAVVVDAKNILTGSLGLEYAYSDIVKMRAGYSADQSPYEEGTLHPAFFDSGLKHSLNLGLGLEFESVRLDVATQYQHFPESKDGGNIDLDNDGIMDNLPGTYKGSAFESVFQFTVKF